MNNISKYKKIYIKTIIVLLIMLGISRLDTMKTHAYFTEIKDINNELIINTGECKVSIDSNIIIDKENKKFTQFFYITNTGTLDQILDVKFRNFTNVDILDNFQCTFDMSQEDNSLDLKNKNITSLKDLYNTDGNKVTLKAGESIKCNLTVDISSLDEESLKNAQNKSIEFDTEVRSTSIDLFVFNDISKLSNKITIEQFVEDDISSIADENIIEEEVTLEEYVEDGKSEEIIMSEDNLNKE